MNQRQKLPRSRNLGVDDGPVIVSPSAPKAFVQSDTTPNGEAQAPEAAAPGLEGEETIWEGHYSSKNFIGRVTLRRIAHPGLALPGLQDLGTARNQATSRRSGPLGSASSWCCTG